MATVSWLTVWSLSCDRPKRNMSTVDHSRQRKRHMSHCRSLPRPIPKPPDVLMERSCRLHTSHRPPRSSGVFLGRPEHGRTTMAHNYGTRPWHTTVAHITAHNHKVPTTCQLVGRPVETAHSPISLRSRCVAPIVRRIAPGGGRRASNGAVSRGAAVLNVRERGERPPAQPVELVA